jgi:hypothetical protein
MMNTSPTKLPFFRLVFSEGKIAYELHLSGHMPIRKMLALVLGVASCLLASANYIVQHLPGLLDLLHR